ncbi:MAG TPA: divergent polysaccharide deacetylase family protein [Candidatus Rubrimentiphilum sp.]|nr:divergent polysaccharide deacetylase family protein [Candidatus Rubrimentiphilum sp.]
MGRRLLLLTIAFFLALFVAWALFGHMYGTPRRPVLSRNPRETPATIETPAPARLPAATAVPAGTATSAPSPAASGTITVAIIIDDCGQWPATERGFLALPIPLTLSILPHVRYTAQIASDAAAAGKGIMLHLPMEPLGRDTAGPGEITTAMTDAQIASTMQDDIAQVPAARGLNNHEGSKASADGRVMKDVIAAVKEHDLFFIDSRTNAQSVAGQTARAASVPEASRDVFLDNRADEAYSEQMLEQTVAFAKRNGSAIAIGHPRPTTLAALAAFYPKMQAEGVRFVLASDLAR